MAYGVIIYESEHDILMSMADEDAGKIVKNMIRAFKGEETETLERENAYSISLCKRVRADKDKIVEKVVAGSRGGAPKGNKNASKNKQKQTETSKTTSETSKTTNNNNYNYNNNNKTLYKSNQFTAGMLIQDYNFKELEERRVRN